MSKNPVEVNPEEFIASLNTEFQALPAKASAPRRRGASPGTPSAADIIRAIRPTLRNLIAEKGYSFDEVYEMVSKRGIKLAKSTLKGYLYSDKREARQFQASETGVERFFGAFRSGRSDIGVDHDRHLADSALD